MTKLKSAAAEGEKKAGALHAFASQRKGNALRQSSSAKAGLTLPVSRVNRLIKKQSGVTRVGGSSPVYLTAVAEFVAAEVIELAGNYTLRGKRKQISLEDVSMAIRGDPELSYMLSSFRMISVRKIQAKRPV